MTHSPLRPLLAGALIIFCIGLILIALRPQEETGLPHAEPRTIEEDLTVIPDTPSIKEMNETLEEQANDTFFLGKWHYRTAFDPDDIHIATINYEFTLDRYSLDAYPGLYSEGTYQVLSETDGTATIELDWDMGEEPFTNILELSSKEDTLQINDLIFIELQ